MKHIATMFKTISQYFRNRKGKTVAERKQAILAEIMVAILSNQKPKCSSDIFNHRLERLRNEFYKYVQYHSFSPSMANSPLTHAQFGEYISREMKHEIADLVERIYEYENE